jgi:dihydrodipicolinate synthase/N-acetylneuraminate lyase
LILYGFFESTGKDAKAYVSCHVSSQNMSKKDKLKGIVVSLPTPTDENHDINYDRFREHVSWLVSEGLVESKAVLMGAGGLGEGYFLTREEHEKVMEALVDAANGNVPTMSGIFQS